MKVTNPGIPAFDFFEKKVETSDPFDLDIRIDDIKEGINLQAPPTRNGCSAGCSIGGAQTTRCCY